MAFGTTLSVTKIFQGKSACGVETKKMMRVSWVSGVMSVIKDFELLLFLDYTNKYKDIYLYLLV